ncbi:MAG: hypothetical protein ACREUK_08100 [Burkholderiales bacterium]
MRCNDHDVTGGIRTTDSTSVKAEVERLYGALYDSASPRTIERAFADIERCYQGEHPEYYPCDTEYHDLQHVLEVTLAMARLMDGYERGRRNGTPRLPPELFMLGVLSALFHDFGYLRRRSDRRHGNGAEYTLVHVSRGAAFLRQYMRNLGTGRLADIAPKLLHFTGYEHPVERIRVADTLIRRVGQMLGSADIIAQMADRCYLEKCRDRLYPEFVLGGLTRRELPGGFTQDVFLSGEDLVRKTPDFYHHAQRRLDLQLARAYAYAESHFGGQNLYFEEMQKNVRYAEVLAEASEAGMLRRTPPAAQGSEAETMRIDMVVLP